jgi:hypothetical protein
MQLIPDGATITVNGNTGEVTVIDSEAERSKDDSALQLTT